MFHSFVKLVFRTITVSVKPAPRNYNGYVAVFTLSILTASYVNQYTCAGHLRWDRKKCSSPPYRRPYSGALLGEGRFFSAVFRAWKIFLDRISAGVYGCIEFDKQSWFCGIPFDDVILWLPSGSRPDRDGIYLYGELTPGLAVFIYFSSCFSDILSIFLHSEPKAAVTRLVMVVVNLGDGVCGECIRLVTGGRSFYQESKVGK